ncbi:MAG: hypothetical protein H0X69_08300 [Gemmatimonadales bacterium]|nr:hypothetical protein [Gemmatimonadales bacterium]
MNPHMTLVASALVILLGGSAPTSGLAQAATESVTVTLRPVGNSSVSGKAVLHARGRETDFDYSLNATDRANQQREYDVWLRAGSCAAPGRKREELDDLKADGRGEQEDEDVVLADLLATEHILQVRVEDRDQVVACGDIRRVP